MRKLSHSGLVALSGIVWLGVGLFLMPLGLRLLYGVIENTGSAAEYPLISLMSPYTGGAETSAVILIAAGLMIGSIKVKYVLSKTIQRVISRILTLSNPAAITNIYGMKYLYLVAIMMTFGMAIKYFNVPVDIRGLIDVAVGSALMTGGLTYLRVAYDLRSKKKSEPTA